MNLPPLKYNADGLIPAIVQDAKTHRVLMMAWMNAASLEATLRTGCMNYWSRSRQKFWLKGETSGHIQKVVRWAADCDADTLLFEVEQLGGACTPATRAASSRRSRRMGRLWKSASKNFSLRKKPTLPIR